MGYDLCLSLLVICGAEVQTLSNALLDGTDLFTLSMLSVLQLGHKHSELLFPVVTELHDGIHVLCVLQRDGHQYNQSVIETPGIFLKSHQDH